MTGAISAISGSSSVSTSSSSSQLTDATKKKLEALGIDTAKIKTETEGLAKLKEAQASQASQAAQASAAPPPPPGGISPEDVKTEAKALAASIGVSVGQSDKINDILNKISTKISEMKASAGTDESKKSEVEGFYAQYQAVYTDYQEIESKKSMLSNSLDALANYNKIRLGL